MRIAIGMGVGMQRRASAPADPVLPSPPGTPALFYTMDDPASVTASGGLLTSWADQGGGTALAPQAGQEPAYDADRMFANFAFGQRLDFATRPTINRRDFAFVVIAHLADENNKGILAGDTAGNILFSMNNADPSQLQLYDGGFKTATSVNPASRGRTTVNNGKMIYTATGEAAKSTVGNGFQANDLTVLNTGTAELEHLGGWLNGTNLLSGLVQAVLIYDGLPDMAAVQAWAVTRYGVPIGATTSTIIIGDGDSLMNGFTPTAGERERVNPLAQLSMYNVGGARVHVVALDGWTVSNDTTAARTTSALSTFSGYTNRVVMFWAGTNDIFVSGAPAATVNSNIDTWIASVRAADAGAIIGGCTIIDRGADDADRATVNTHIRTTADFDFVVDLAADARLSDAADTTYYQADAVHLTPTGYGVAAELMRDALETAGVI